MIGERLRVARARARKSLREVAAECGVTAQAVKKYEDDVYMPKSSTFHELCRCLDISSEWLIDPAPLDFKTNYNAVEGRHVKEWVREAISELRDDGYLD